jgi:hypothetical protein
VRGDCAVGAPFDGSDDTNASERRETMSRIPRPSHGLVVAAIALVTALAAAALPLAALAEGGPPLGF